MNLSAFSDVETQISKIKIENEVDSLKNYISLQGQVHEKVVIFTKKWVENF